jgi:hypothetical protein
LSIPKLHLSRIAASIWLTCHAVDCTLQITPPSREGTTEFKFSRKQLVRTDSIVVDKDHQFVRFDTGPPAAHHYSAKARKKKKQSRSGPDIDGNFATYTIVLRPPIENTDPNDETGQYEADLTPLEDFTYRDADTDNVVLHMRKYNLGKTHRRSKTMSNKIDSYVKQRRHQLVIKENAPISWQGILALVIGLFLLLLTVLIGQFAEEPRTGGPGTRRSAGSSSSSTARRSSGGTSRKHTSGKLH